MHKKLKWRYERSRLNKEKFTLTVSNLTWIELMEVQSLFIKLNKEKR